MGVRFECPAGHKLHVKAELAGKRGICPECGAKFIVPSFSGQRVAEDNGAATTSTVVVNSPAASTITPPPVPGAPPPPVEPTAWYIRPASGGQFGPASDEVFAQWIAEARVSADSWVWRNGWADWKAGGEAIREFNSRPRVAPPAALPPVATDADEEFEDEPTISVDLSRPVPATAVAAAPVELSPADQRRAEIKRRKQQVRNLSIALGIVALLMLAVLIFVVARGNGEEATKPQEENPAAASAAVPDEETPAEQPPAEAPKEEPKEEPASE